MKGKGSNSHPQEVREEFLVAVREAIAHAVTHTDCCLFALFLGESGS